MKTAEVELTSYAESVKAALDSIDAASVLSEKDKILLKPNLINDSPHPITTHPDCCAAIVDYIHACSDAEIVIGEGCGDSHLETDQVFDALGYRKLADDLGLELIDLNHAELRHMKNPDCPVFPEMYLPEIAMSHYLISIPVLKAHSFSVITGTLKNMIGLAPPEHYSGQYGSWKKAVFHGDMHQSIIDLNAYRTPDLSVMDAAIGMPDFHLGGSHCNPPVNKILAGFDPIDLDRKAASLLDFDWQSIDHLRD